MKCAACGRALEPGAGFCNGCGFAVSPAGAATATEPGVPPSSALRAPAEGYAAAGTVVDGKYEVERVLGEGGMGVVYLARDRNTGMRVVLKAVRAELAHRKDVRE